MVREAKAALAREWAANPQGALAPASYLGGPVSFRAFTLATRQAVEPG